MIQACSHEVSSNLVFAGHGVPAHGNATDGAKRHESLLDGVLAGVVVDAANIDP